MLMQIPYYGELSGVKIHGTDLIIDTANSIIERQKKIDFIFKVVKSKILWNEEEEIICDDLDEIWKKGKGTNADINLTILNLLRRAHIDCYPILVRERTYGKPDRDFFSLKQFNNVDILILDSVNFYVLDGTKKQLSYKTPPFEILNREVLLINSSEGKWLKIIDLRPLIKQTVSIKASLNTDGQLGGNAAIFTFDYLKEKKIKEESTNQVDSTDNEDSKEFLLRAEIDVKIDSLVELNAGDQNLPLNENLHFSYKVDRTSEYLFIDPWFLYGFRKNPFIDTKRNTDIDLGSNQFFSLSFNFSIPDEYEIESMPKNILLMMEDSSIMIKRQCFSDTNTILFKYTFELKKAEFPKQEYPALRDFFKKVYAFMNDQIILKKRT
jgi:hypothetical protein